MNCFSVLWAMQRGDVVKARWKPNIQTKRTYALGGTGVKSRPIQFSALKPLLKWGYIAQGPLWMGDIYDYLITPLGRGVDTLEGRVWAAMQAVPDAYRVALKYDAHLTFSNPVSLRRSGETYPANLEFGFWAFVYPARNPLIFGAKLWIPSRDERRFVRLLWNEYHFMQSRTHNYEHLTRLPSYWASPVGEKESTK